MLHRFIFREGLMLGAFMFLELNLQNPIRFIENNIFASTRFYAGKVRTGVLKRSWQLALISEHPLKALDLASLSKIQFVKVDQKGALKGWEMNHDLNF